MSYTYKDEQYPSVSTILGQLDKSGALIPWSLNCYESKMLELIQDELYDNEDGYIIYENVLEDIIKQAKKEYKNVSGEALDIGTQVHDAIEQYIKTGKDLTGELKPEVENGFIAFLEWEKEHVDKWLESEIKTVNTKYGYGGTYDAIFQHKNGKIIMLDFKTSKAIYPENWLQLSAYKKARETLSGEYSIFFDRGQTATFNYNLEPIKIDGVGILRLDKITGLPEYKRRDEKRAEHDWESFKSLTNFYYQHKKRRLKNNSIVKYIWS